MDKIASFTVDHTRLKPGLYVSRKDIFGAVCLTTFDLRMTAPGREPVMGTAEVHTLEHLGATFLRNHPQWKERVVYFGPMGCRTGFYLILEGDRKPEEVLPLLKETFRYMADFDGPIPGADARSCGNYRDMNPEMARYYARRYLTGVLESGELPTEYPA